VLACKLRTFVMALPAEYLNFRLSDVPPNRRPRPPRFETLVQAAMRRGFVVGREVMIGDIPGVVVGYNIAGFGRFIGAAYPLVIRTELGVAKCHPDEITLL
jgi:hypothetical protein